MVVQDDFAHAFTAQDFLSDVIDVSVGADDGNRWRFCRFVGVSSKLEVGVESGVRVVNWCDRDIGLHLRI